MTFPYRHRSARPILSGEDAFISCVAECTGLWQTDDPQVCCCAFQSIQHHLTATSATPAARPQPSTPLLCPAHAPPRPCAPLMLCVGPIALCPANNAAPTCER